MKIIIIQHVTWKCQFERVFLGFFEFKPISTPFQPMFKTVCGQKNLVFVCLFKMLQPLSGLGGGTSNWSSRWVVGKQRVKRHCIPASEAQEGGAAQLAVGSKQVELQ